MNLLIFLKKLRRFLNQIFRILIEQENGCEIFPKPTQPTVGSPYKG